MQIIDECLAGIAPNAAAHDRFTSFPPVTIQQAYDAAVQHHQSGRLPEAEAIYRQILAVEPRHADSLHLLGILAHQVGQNAVAVDLIRQAIALTPAVPEFHSNLGEAYLALGQTVHAIAAYRQAIALQPNSPEACTNLAAALNDAGRHDEAVIACHQAIALRPDLAEAHNNLGIALNAREQLDQAIAAYHQAITLKPDYPEAHLNLGNALHAKGNFEGAIASYRQAIALKSNYPEAYSNLGVALKDTGQLDEAIAACRQSIAFEPNSPEAYNNLGGALFRTGQLDEAIAAYRRAITLKPNSPEIHSKLLFTLNYRPGLNPQTVAEEHRHWNQQHTQPLRQFIQPNLNDSKPDRRLRIGYVSPDFREHPVGRFLLPLLAHHDHDGFEVFAYAQVPTPDAMTERLRSHADGWRSLVGLSDAQAAELIRQDHIDILVDLAGHTANNRLLVFAREPAPVQVTWLGYPNTTGLDSIDYRFTDAFADPPGLTELHCSEKLIRLSSCAWCFDPGTGPLIAERRGGPITFGCFNNFTKITEPMLTLWGRILQAVPDSRLLLKSASFGSTSATQKVQRVLEKFGMTPERLELRGYEADHRAHLARYEWMDIALDTFPYHGTTTTCEALWMGVPVVTLAGHDHVSRVGVSLLSNAGLPELVAASADEYLRLATGLASDLPRLAELRRTLRPRMEGSPLMDAPRFARNVEAAYREMWHQWCTTRG